VQATCAADKPPQAIKRKLERAHFATHRRVTETQAINRDNLIYRGNDSGQ
jgi:hypothetical protein